MGEFKYFKSTYDFDDMIVYTQEGWSKLKFVESEGLLYRLASNKMQRLAPAVTKAYLDYRVDKILLED